MKVRKKSTTGESNDLLLKEYFLNAYLIALLKQFGGEVKRRNEKRAADRAGTAPVVTHN